MRPRTRTATAPASDNATPDSIVRARNTKASASCRKTGRANPSSGRMDTKNPNPPTDCAAAAATQMSPPARRAKAAKDVANARKVGESFVRSWKSQAHKRLCRASLILCGFAANAKVAGSSLHFRLKEREKKNGVEGLLWRERAARNCESSTRIVYH